VSEPTVIVQEQRVALTVAPEVVALTVAPVIELVGSDKFYANIGNGSSTTIAVTHSLNTSDIVWKIRQASTPYAEIITDAEVTDANTLTLKFAVAPATNELRVTIIG